jgi:hypothetical protein
MPARRFEQRGVSCHAYRPMRIAKVGVGTLDAQHQELAGVAGYYENETPQVIQDLLRGRWVFAPR